MNPVFVDRIINSFTGKRHALLVIANQEFDLPDTFWKAIVQHDFGMAAIILTNKHSGHKATFIADSLWEG